jgi:hypothetical protein
MALLVRRVAHAPWFAGGASIDSILLKRSCLARGAHGERLLSPWAFARIKNPRRIKEKIRRGYRPNNI